MMKKKIFLTFLILAFIAAGCGGTQSTGNFDQQAFEDAVDAAVAERLADYTKEDAAPEMAADFAEDVLADTGTDSVAEVSRADSSNKAAAVVSNPETESVSAADAGTGLSADPAISVDVAPASSSSTGANVDDDGPPCYRAEFVGETIPDGSVFSPGDGFAKSWTLKNTGSCEWGKSFTFEYVSGNWSFRAPTVTKLTNKQILPKDTVTITLEMAAPTEPGHYLALYKIYNENGVVVTPNGVWVSIWVDYE